MQKGLEHYGPLKNKNTNTSCRLTLKCESVSCRYRNRIPNAHQVKPATRQAPSLKRAVQLRPMRSNFQASNGPPTPQCESRRRAEARRHQLHRQGNCRILPMFGGIPADQYARRARPRPRHVQGFHQAQAVGGHEQGQHSRHDLPWESRMRYARSVRNDRRREVGGGGNDRR